MIRQVAARAAGLGLLLGCAQTDLVARRADDTCAAGKPCTGPESCEPQLCPAAESRSALCQNTGLPVLAGDGCSAEPDSLPLWRFAVCSCSDFISSSSVTIDAFTGAPGNVVPGQGALGVNRDLSLPSATRIGGAVEVVGNSSLAAGVAVRPVRVARQPCQCAGDKLLDVAGAVAARRDDNDNNSGAALAVDSLDGFSGAFELTLDCGRYYFTRIAGRQKLTLRTRGNVAIYVAGNLELDDALEVSGDGPVSLFVAGEIRVRGPFSLGGGSGSSSKAGLFADSRGTIDLGGSSVIAGNLYAPHAELVNSGSLVLYGSLLVRRAAPAAELVVHYDTAESAPRSCLP